MKPWMSDNDIAQIESLITNKLNNKGKIDVLEWGSGGSTEYFGKHMLSSGIHYSWESIEYNKKWYDKMISLKLPHTNIVLFDVGNDQLKQVKTNMDDYVNYPKTLNKKFDMILVDGRKRRRCLVLSARLLKYSGFVLLHDAERKYYHCAFNMYKRYKFLTKTLWIGKNE